MPGITNYRNEEFNVGEKVIYSDLSPWEEATIVAVHPDSNEATLDFHDDLEPLRVSTDGMRPHTPENVAHYLGDSNA